MTAWVIPPTERQLQVVRDLQRRLRITDRALDQHCRERFEMPLSGIDRRQMSALLDEMLAWKAAPAALQRAQGQLDLLDPGP